MKITDKDVLLVVDVQNDFCPGGALPVPRGDQVVPPINRAMTRFEHVAFSRDWHPHDHCSFGDPPAFADKSWPEHCVEDTPGAEFHGDLRVPLDAIFVLKGTDREKEAYSAFDGTALAEKLRAKGIHRVFVAGLATDYCVRATALDSRKHGFETVVLEDACRGIAEESRAVAMRDMEAAGVIIGRTGDFME